MNRKCLRRRIDKSLLATLPIDSFEGRIFTIISVAEADKAVDYLFTKSAVGLDTETRPSFVSGKRHKVALLQLATHDECFLFRLNRIGLTPRIKAFLESEEVIKIGLSLRDDLNALRHREDIQPKNWVDLQQIAPTFGIEDLSLQKLYANLFECNISKSQRLSNWEADVLTDRQKVYAATDAWACYRMYHYLQELKASGDYELEPLPPTNQTDNYETN